MREMAVDFGGLLSFLSLVVDVPISLTPPRVGSNESFSLLGLAHVWRVSESPCYWWLAPTNLRASSDGLIGFID
jgi:hypothetical protein